MLNSNLLPKKYRKPLAITLLGVLVIRAFDMLPIVIVGKVIDSLHHLDNTFYGLSFLLIALAFLRPLIHPWQAKNLNQLVLDANRDISVGWTQAILHKDYRFFQDTNVGKLLRQADRGILAHEKLLTLVITAALPNMIELIVIAFYLIYIAGIIIMAPTVIATLIFIVFSLRTIAWRRAYIDAVNQAEDTVSEHFTTVFQAAKSIKIFGAWVKGTALLENAYNLYAQSAKKLSFVSTVLSSGQLAIVLLTQIATLILGVVVSYYSAGTLIVAFIYAGFFMERIASLLTIYKELDQCEADQHEIEAVLALPDFRTPIAKGKPNHYGITILPFSQAKIVNDTIIHIPQGACVAIIGATGEGKTTFANVVAGTLTTRKTVYIGNVDLADFSEKTIVNTIGYSYQDPDFLRGDFNHSVLFNQLKASNKALASLIKTLHLNKILSIEKCGEDIPINTLSGGEAKRLALLRILLAQKPITIIDEPTSAMDTQTANTVWKTLFRVFHQKTLLCITHDEKWLDRFDIVIAVRNHNVTVEKLFSAAGPIKA